MKCKKAHWSEQRRWSEEQPGYSCSELISELWRDLALCAMCTFTHRHLDVTTKLDDVDQIASVRKLTPSTAFQSLNKASARVWRAGGGGSSLNFKYRVAACVHVVVFYLLQNTGRPTGCSSRLTQVSRGPAPPSTLAQNPANLRGATTAGPRPGSTRGGTGTRLTADRCLG